jgi:hypothetical protein
MHLLHQCRALPEDILQERNDVLIKRVFEFKAAYPLPLKEGMATKTGPAWSAALKWDGMSPQLASRLLWLSGRIIDFYSKRSPPWTPSRVGLAVMLPGSARVSSLLFAAARG